MWVSTGCPNKFRICLMKRSEAQKSLRAKRATFTKKGEMSNFNDLTGSKFKITPFYWVNIL